MRRKKRGSKVRGRSRVAKRARRGDPRKKPGRGRRLLRAKAQARRDKKQTSPRVVYRDASGKFASRSSRERRGIQVIGREGYAKPAVRSRKEQAQAVSGLGGKRFRTYTAQTRTGTMADRLLQARSNGSPLALAFARGKQSGTVSVVAGELSFSVVFDGLDLQELIAETLVAYFQRAHAVRERVSAKARTGGGTHGGYELVRSVDVVVRIKGNKV